MKVAAAIIAALAVIVGIFFFFDLEQTQEAELPSIEITGGQSPEFDVEAGDIDLGTSEVTITVPTVDLESPEEERLENQ